MKSAVTLAGVVVEVLPRGLYRVVLDDRRELVAHAARAVDRNFVRVLAGDRVAVELTARDRTRGRITRRLGPGASGPAPDDEVGAA